MVISDTGPVVELVFDSDEASIDAEKLHHPIVETAMSC